MDGTEGTIDTQIAHLWQTILGNDIDAETAQSLRQVFDEIVGLATSVNRQDPQADAWIGVLAAVLQDPSLTLY